MKRRIGLLLLATVFLFTGCQGGKQAMASQETSSQPESQTAGNGSDGSEEIRIGTVTEIGDNKVFVFGDSRQWGDRQMWVQFTEETEFVFDDGQPASFADIAVDMTLTFHIRNGTMTMMLPPTVYGCVKVILPRE